MNEKIPKKILDRLVEEANAERFLRPVAFRDPESLAGQIGKTIASLTPEEKAILEQLASEDIKGVSPLYVRPKEPEKRKRNLSYTFKK